MTTSPNGRSGRATRSRAVASRPAALAAGQGESVWSLGGRFTVKADSELTEGRLALVESVAYRSTEPPLHVHTREDEAWYVLDGAMTFFVGDEAYPATAGSFVYAPMGIPHTFTVDAEPTRVLVLAAPAGFEHFALELGAPTDTDAPPADAEMPSPEVLGAVGDRYGIQVVGPPRRISHPDEA
jgi:mannose-6-phosphate isomerase-like protein (cupin superfamily)